MILRTLSDPDRIKSSEGIPHFSDHCLFVKNFSKVFSYPSHFTGLGLIAVLEGKARVTINHEHVHLDSNAFLLINRGSELSIKGVEKGVIALLYFNSILSEILTNTIFQRMELSTRELKDYHDFSLVEHVHYQNASLKHLLPLLIDLGTSCASFHALKADALIRKILDDVISENFSAIQSSSRIKVVRKSTRIALYKRMSMAKDWLEQNYASAIVVNQMADIAMLNPYHFLRIFKKVYGVTPHRYLSDFRIARAQTLLLETDLSVSDICHSVGFDSLSSFSALFKSKTGNSPTQFRVACRVKG